MNAMLRGLFHRLPFHVRQSITSVRAHWRGRRPSFAGVYSSFEEAGGSVEDVAADQVAAGLMGAQSPELRHGHALLPLAVAMLAHKKKPLRILDFGGGCGKDYVTVKATAPGAQVDYHIVELPAVCRAGRSKWDGEISFHESIPQGDFDIVFAWGAIQYVADPHSLLRKLAAKHPQIILIAGTAFSSRAFVRRQVNQARPYPHWVLSLPDTEAIMQSLGYRLAFRAETGEGFNVDNFAPEYRVPNYMGLLFTGEHRP